MIPFPAKKYEIIYADPAWSYNDKLAARSMHHQAAEAHYSVMSLADIKALPVASIADDNCILFMWVTMPLLVEGLAVIESWGFKYKTNAFTWIKTWKKSKAPFLGLGRWTRGNAELCLLAVKGKPKRVSKDISSVVISPVREHSRKPDEVRDLIVKLCGDLPRIELFSRNNVKGWDCWGDQAPSEIKRGLLDG